MDERAREWGYQAVALSGLAGERPAALLLPILTDQDVLMARQAGRAVAERLDFSATALTEIATAISEVARNIIVHAGRGEIVLIIESLGGYQRLVIHARDQGPGIADTEQAMREGYSTKNGSGLGLPGASNLMDEFTIHSEVGKGTLIRMIKWERRPS